MAGPCRPLCGAGDPPFQPAPPRSSLGLRPVRVVESDQTIASPSCRVRSTARVREYCSPVRTAGCRRHAPDFEPETMPLIQPMNAPVKRQKELQRVVGHPTHILSSYDNQNLGRRPERTRSLRKRPQHGHWPRRWPSRVPSGRRSVRPGARSSPPSVAPRRGDDARHGRRAQ